MKTRQSRSSLEFFVSVFAFAFLLSTENLTLAFIVALIVFVRIIKQSQSQPKFTPYYEIKAKQQKAVANSRYAARVRKFTVSTENEYEPDDQPYIGDDGELTLRKKKHPTFD
jgi:hypothetical protein